MFALQVYDNPFGSGANMVGDYTHRAAPPSWTMGENGYQSCTVEITMAPWEAFQLYERPGLLWLVVSDWACGVAWEGRIEDVAIVPGGVRITAMGAWQGLTDLPYTALWSDDKLERWRELVETELSTARPDRYQFDERNRLYCAPQKNSTQGTTTVAKRFQWGYEPPDGGSRQIVAISFDWVFKAPVNWIAEYQRYDSSWTQLATTTIANGNGAVQSGTVTVSLTACDRVGISMRYNAADAAYAGETGDDYLRITNVRTKTITSASVLASDIAAALLTFVTATNSATLNSTSAMIQAGDLDLTDAVYEDRTPAEILRDLALLGDTSSQRWEAAVWNGRILTFAPYGTFAKTWYVLVEGLTLERSIGQLTNSVYATYQEARSRTLRTASSTNADSVAQYGLTRRQQVGASTTSSTRAGQIRDTALADTKDPPGRASITIERVFENSMGLGPLSEVRPGDTLVIINLPPTRGTTIDRIRTFRIGETSYDASSKTLTVTPEEPLPELAMLLAKQEAR